MKNVIRIGTRGSKLALRQTESVAARIRELNPEISIEIIPVTTKGDIYSSSQMRSDTTGIFTKELEVQLLNKNVDMAVHSMKDVPLRISKGLLLSAVLEREDPRDSLVSNMGSLRKMPPGSFIYTSSLRRQIQLYNYRPDLHVAQIRGNIDTRIQKMADLHNGGIIVAAAGLIRLGLKDKITEYLPPAFFLPAPGQGAIVVQSRLDDTEIYSISKKLNHDTTWRCTIAERKFLENLGGGCRTPIGALALHKGDKIELMGMICDAQQKTSIKASIEGDSQFPEELGNKLATIMLQMGAQKSLNNDQKL